MKDLIYDIETYKNCLLITFLNCKTMQLRTFEISDRKNEWKEFHIFVDKCADEYVRWVGFNNYYFDYPVVHYLLEKFPKNKPFSGHDISLEAHNYASKIINADKNEKFDMVIWDNNQLVPQVDIYRIHHFDNMAKATSLKILEFNMRSETIEDLPFPPEKELADVEMDILIDYNIHDVTQTHKFYLETLDMIKFREELSEKYRKNFLNHNDTKIGKDYFIMELEKAGIDCYTYEDGSRKPVQTKRSHINIGDLIFPYIKFERPEFNAVLDWLKKQRITETKGVFTEIDDLGELEKYANLKKVKGKVKNLNCIIDGFQFDFGTGGIHGSVEPTIVCEDDKHMIIDYDVTSLYPSIAIVNNVYPEHLTKTFCPIYARLKRDRVSYEKGTPENAMLKLALNGVYGDSNNKYSPFYDPKYTMTITINGQLLLCMLAEMFMKIDGVQIIQINTDGVTIKAPVDWTGRIHTIAQSWENITKLELERVDYKRMFIRDVNNYIAEDILGKLKRKGTYEYNLDWHQNHSALVVQKAAEANLVHNIKIDEFIKNHDDVFDFMLRTKVPRSSTLIWGEKQVQNTSRYYMSKNGNPLTKIMPPLKGKVENRHIRIHVGENVRVMNKMNDVKDINYDWYIGEAVKLVKPLYNGVLREMMV